MPQTPAGWIEVVPGLAVAPGYEFPEPEQIIAGCRRFGDQLKDLLDYFNRPPGMRAMEASMYGRGVDIRTLTNKQLNDLMGGEQRNLLKKFFGQGLKEAQARSADFNVPQGLTQDTLKIYKEIAERAINAGKDSTGVQAERLKLIVRALQQGP